MQVSTFPFYKNKICFSFISFERHRTFNEVASKLYQEFYQTIESNAAIILRPFVGTPLTDLSTIKSEYELIIERFPFQPLYFLHSNDFEIILSDNLNEKAISIPEIESNKEKFCQYIRQKEMEGFVLNSSAICIFRRMLTHHSVSC